MEHNVTWIDRLRIERVVWVLDQRLYELPRRSRIATRREVRDNLLAAAADVGAREAIRKVGDGSRLAHEYIAAEYGDGPRHSWLAAALFAMTIPLVLTSLLAEAASAYADGVVAANPHVTGAYTWSGIDYLQSKVTYTFVDGHSEQVGGAFTPLTWALWFIGTVLVGRLWRFTPWWRHRHNAQAKAIPSAR